MTSLRLRWPLAAAFLAALVFGVAGCGSSKTYPVEGKLVWEDGSPVKELTGGTVVFEAKGKGKDGGAAASASGAIEADGTFRMSTFRPNDGVPPGEYHVAVVQPLEEGKDRLPPRLIPQHFEVPDKSGLTVTVEAKHNEPVLTLLKGTRKGRR